MESPSVCIKKITFYANFSSFYMIIINLSPVRFSHKKAAHPDGHTLSTIDFRLSTLNFPLYIHAHFPLRLKQGSPFYGTLHRYRLALHT